MNDGTSKDEATTGCDPVAEHQRRAATYLADHLNGIHSRTDRLFGWLMVGQYVAGIATAIWISPHTWSGTRLETHTHVYAAVILGALIVSLPIFLSRFKPGHTVTRHVIAAAQGLMSALLIHLSGGRIETHFHVFGSLALIAFYRDWRVLVTASVVITADHLARGLFWPQSVFGVVATGSWRWLEHALWVLVEDTFLMRSCVQGVSELRAIADQRTDLEQTNERIEEQISKRTAELKHREAELSAILYAAADGVLIADEHGCIQFLNRTAESLFKIDSESAKGDSLLRCIQAESESDILHAQSLAEREFVAYTNEFVGVRHDGETFPLEATITSVEETAQRRLFVWATRDLTERKRAEKARNELHQQRIETARMAGMSQIATGVLHNVGNALNSVNVSANLMQGYLGSSKTTRVNDLATLLQEHQHELLHFLTEDPRGQRIPKYMGALGEQITAEQALHANELERLICQIEYIKRIIGTQQSIAGSAELVEELDVASKIDDTIESIGLADGRTISVERDFQYLPKVMLDRPRFMQILFNLVRNAKESILEGQPQFPSIQVSLKADHETNEFELSIRDNGIGIDTENLNKVFSHGYSTKTTGNGFGLHSCANAANEMGGSLTAASPGLGKGATFTLRLPISPVSAPLMSVTE